LLIASFFFFYKSIFPKEKNTTILFVSLLFIVLHVLNMRTLFEGLYWTFASLSYQVAIIVFIIGAGSLIRNTRNVSPLFSIIAIVCSFILPGCIESIAPLYFIFLLVSFWVCFKQKKSLIVILICIVINLAAIAIVLASKGNYVRVSYNTIQYKSNIFLASYYAMRSLGYYCFIWIINPANIFALLLLFPFLIKVINKATLAFANCKNKKSFFIFLVIAFVMCFSIYFPEHYFESDVPYPRITTIFFFTAFHIFLVACFLFFPKENQNKFFNNLFAVTTRYQSYIAIIFFVIIFCSRNFISITSDLVTGTACNYALESKQRYETLKNCTADTCYVSRHKYWASSIENFKKEELNTNPFIHIDKFFGKKILYKDSIVNANK